MSFDEPWLRALVQGDSCVLRPRTYFVAWNGVLTLVYDGFPPVLAGIKARLNEEDDLPPENFGSRWPKTTLAALQDDAPPLSLAELTRLRALCEEYASQLSLRVPVSSLSFVSYDQRGLESGSTRSDVALGSAVDDSEPSDAEQARVRGVLDEWSDLETYLPRVNAPGSRISSYRESSPAGQTLVAFVGTTELQDLVAQFRSAVDALLPGRYAWLDDASLHCTVRALG